ncbi:hypothetical protein [Alteromonas sp. C1M14]|uniref:hypothetical protein n=1 Tax=Alteromonas sp. C1M14 TaxID=2841567 RepID=UPI001C090C13|nr:hypothetical protein [Alteromonas sp. C1M14]MBU2978485.1 hypothetical protein [Alteromonas sp. C1M14]
MTFTKQKTMLCLPALVLALVSTSSWGAAKPVTGVSCQGGFFIRTPDKHIHWINDEKDERVQVYEDKDEIYAMAECGTGVITVFEKSAEDKQEYAAYYSPNCQHIGSEEGETQNLYKGELKINRIKPDEEGVEIRFVNNQTLRGASCSALNQG